MAFGSRSIRSLQSQTEFSTGSIALLGVFGTMWLRKKVFHLWFLLSRPMTLGVRICVTNGKDEIMLVRHTYVKGWHLPGGGVDVGESCDHAALRELSEETGLQPSSPPKLFGVYFNNHVSKRDHVVLYVCETAETSSRKTADKEIAEARFFPLSDLPTDVSAAVSRRLSELFDGADISPRW